MKIRLGPAGIPMCCKGLSTLEGLKKTHELGLDAMEIAFTHGIYMSVDSARKIGEAAKEFDIEMSVHAPYYVNLASETEKIVVDSKKRIMDSLERADAMGATMAVVHAGYYGKDVFRSSQMILEACSEISDTICSSGWKTKLGLETMGRQKSWGTVDEIVGVCKKLRHVVPCVDWAHLYALGAGSVDFPSVFDMLDSLKLDLYHCHFSGIKYSLVKLGKGNEKGHVPLNEGGPDFKMLAKEIIKRKKDMTIVSESPLLEVDSLLMKSILENLGHRF